MPIGLEYKVFISPRKTRKLETGMMVILYLSILTYLKYL